MFINSGSKLCYCFSIVSTDNTETIRTMQSTILLALVAMGCLAAVAQAGESTAILKCVDFADACKGWSEMGDCEKDKEFMHQYCRRSCNACTKKACDDKFIRVRSSFSFH